MSAARENLKTVALVTLGCARNEVDSEELAGRLAEDGWKLTSDVGKADIALVNTCGFIESAKKDSVDALLEAHSLKATEPSELSLRLDVWLNATGNELAEALPEGGCNSGI